MSTLLYRNWTAIARINNPNLMAALIGINLETDEGQRLQSAFSECFSLKCVFPVWLSVLQAYALGRDPLRETCLKPEEALYYCSALGAHEIPVIKITFDRENFQTEELGEDGWFLPTEHEEKMLRSATFGQEIEFRGCHYRVAEQTEYEVFLVPVEAIDMNR